MAYTHKPNSGSLFKNTEKQSDTHADYRGDAVIECPHCKKGFAAWLNAWVNEGTKGKFFGIKFKAKDSKASPQRKTTAAEDMNDSIPW